MRRRALVLLAVGCAARPAGPVTTPELARVAYAQAVWAEVHGDAAAAAERRALAALVGGADPRTRAALASSAPLRPDDGVSPTSRAACAPGLPPDAAAARAAAGHAELPTPTSLRLWGALAHDVGDLGVVVAWIADHDAAAWDGAWADAVAAVRHLDGSVADGAAVPVGPGACADLTAGPAGG